MEIAIVYHSGFGHTKIVAESVLQGVKSVTGVIGHLIKVAAGFTNSHSMDDDKHNTLTGLAVFAAQHGMIWINLGISNESSADDQISGNPTLKNRLGSSLGLVAQSENDDPKVTPPVGDRLTAELFGKRVALATQRWVKGA